MKQRICSGLLAIAMLLAIFSMPAAATADLQLAAPSAILIDGATGTVLYESNAHEKLAPASVTKVMTLLLIMEAIDSGRIAWTDMVTASEAAAAKGGSQIYLKVGETMSVEEMVKSVTVSSANDCACALAEHIAGSEAAFVDKMNQRAAELGMKDTHFVNCTGLDDEPNAAEHLTSAYDIALMSRELLMKHPDIKKFTTIWMDTVRGGAFGLSNTNKLVRFYEGTTGLKTGFTRAAGYCLSASAARDGLELIGVVLHCETTNDRFQSAKAMLDYGFANYALISAKGEEAIPAVPVTLGKSEQVQAVVSGEEQLLIEKANQSSITRTVTVLPSVTAPVNQGQQLGTLTVRSGDTVLAELPLVAELPVERLTWKDIAMRLLAKLSMATWQQGEA